MDGDSEMQEDAGPTFDMTLRATKNRLKEYRDERKYVEPHTRIVVKVSIFGDTHEALVDTGASHSFIDTSIVSRYDLSVSKATGFIGLADKTVIPRIGETEHLEVACGRNIVCAPFEVIEQKYALSIGMDLFYRFGFGITGLPDPEPSHNQLPEPIPDEKPPSLLSHLTLRRPLSLSLEKRNSCKTSDP
jgi:hypothetical protein